MKRFLDQRLTFDGNEAVYGEYGNPVMMNWVDEWMYESAKIVCKNGGDILNIGFGLGIVDNYIQKYSINSHTIIEPHPDIHRKIVQDGWYKNPSVKVIYDEWENVIEHLPSYDGIYFDAYEIVNPYRSGGVDFLSKFLPNLKKILKPDGVFAFWPDSIFESYSGPIINFRNNLIATLQNDFVIEKKSYTYTDNEISRKRLKYNKTNNFTIPVITFRDKSKKSSPI